MQSGADGIVTPWAGQISDEVSMLDQQWCGWHLGCHSGWAV